MRRHVVEVHRKPRLDAQRNEHRLIAAARALMRERGIDFTIRQVARATHVGTATVYRHFPSRSSLIDAVLEQQVDGCAAAVRGAVEDPNPAHALVELIRWFADLQIHERALAAAVLTADRPSFVSARQDHARGLEQLVERAHAARMLRPEVAVADVRALLLALSGVGALPPSSAPDVSGRLRTLAFGGLLQPPSGS